MASKKREQPIYEKLAPNECLIVSRDSEGFVVACNKKGDIDFKHVPYSKTKQSESQSKSESE